MKNFLIKRIQVRKLWGYKKIDVSLYPDLNIIIGPNASGKTTILNMLRFLFSGSLDKLIAIPFEQLVVSLSSFDGKSVTQISAQVKNDSLHIGIGEEKFKIPVLFVKEFSQEGLIARFRGHIGTPEPILELSTVRRELADLVPAAWLPVSRRLPKSEQGTFGHQDARLQAESVDERLEELLRELVNYSLKVSNKRSEIHKDFQRRVLLVALYDKKFDNPTFGNIALPTDDQQQELERSFESIGLMDKTVRSRIKEHFSETQSALTAFAKSDKKGQGRPIRVMELLAVPSHLRAMKLVELSRELTKNEEQISRPTRRYEELVSSYLSNKKIEVSANGRLTVTLNATKPEVIETQYLSSGEKQILILLTQALVARDAPIVYVVDEPELSLHVTWQSSLLQSIRELAEPVQIITTTHSPDIVGDYNDRIIKLEAM